MDATTLPGDVTWTLIDLYAKQQEDRIPGLIAQLPSDDPVRRTGEVMVGFANLKLKGQSWKDIQPQVDAALRQPPASPDLQLCLLNLLRYPLLNTQDGHVEREAILQRMRGCAAGLRHPFAVAALHWAEYFSATHRLDLAAARQAAEAGLAASLQVTDTPRFLIRLIEVRLAQRDLAGLDHLLDQLRQFRTPQHQQHERLEHEYMLLTGRAAAVAALADAAPDPERPWLSDLVMEACLRTGQQQRAMAVADRLSGGNPTPIEQRKIDLHRIRALYWQRSYTAAAEAVRASAARHRGHPGWQRLMCMQSVAIDLAQQATAQAQATLLQIDPRADQGDSRMAWIRLYLQRGNQPAAASLFAAIAGQGLPGLVAYELAEAHEVDAPTMFALSQAVLGQPRTAPPSPTLLRAQKGPTPDHEQLVGDSLVMAAVRGHVQAYAQLEQPVLITGETGTGKEIVARLLHRFGGHAEAPFVALNCAALSDSLAESELFGHRKGAFTGAVHDHPGLFGLAGTGTLLLDEINSLSLRLQGLLLRVLETGEYRQIGGSEVLRNRARIIAASNGDLEQAGLAGTFREDLRYRLQRFVIPLPPLRERREDIPALVRHLVDRLDLGRPMTCSADLMAALVAHDWPGNVRELRNVVERMALLSGGRSELTGADCPDISRPRGRKGRGGAGAAKTDTGRVPIGDPRARVRRQTILDLFDRLPRVYAADAIRATGAAPRTVAGDFLALTEQGHLRRVETSAHKRTGYWVKI